MKISFVTTVFNEEKTIKKLIDSLFIQTKLPDEIIIVDGGSTDGTVESIKHHISNIENVKLKVMTKKGNRSVGRNFAIEQASGDIIAVSDAGCILNKNWLKNIVKPFENNNIDVVSGYYKPKTDSIFEKCLAAYTCVMLDKVDPENFLPSSRSVAFRKETWEKVGGYPEELDTCEDLVFDKKLKSAGFKFVFAKDAIVYWPQKKNIVQAFMQFFSYAMGDGQALYIRPQVPFLFARYIVGSALLLIFLKTGSFTILYSLFFFLFFYLVWAICKNYKYVKHAKALIYLPLLQFTSDIAVISGFLVGLIAKRRYGL